MPDKSKAFRSFPRPQNLVIIGQLSCWEVFEIGVLDLHMAMLRRGSDEGVNPTALLPLLVPQTRVYLTVPHSKVMCKGV